MRKLKMHLVIFLAIASLSFNGCVSHEGPTYGEKVISSEINSDLYRLDAVAILDKSLQTWAYVDKDGSHSTKSKLAIENLGIRALPTKNVEVFTTIRNRTDFTQQLLVRTQFFDKDKISVESPTSWQRLILPQNSSITYKSFSITTDRIKHFLIEIKEGD